MVPIPELNEIIVGQIYVLVMILARMGSAFMMMPGIGDFGVSPRVRLLFAVAVSLVLVPTLQPLVPEMPQAPMLLAMLIIAEITIGLFIALVMRTLMSIVDFAGVTLSMVSGMSGALMFSPQSGGQTTVISSFLGVVFIALLFVTNMHHLMIMSMVESYHMMPMNSELMTGDMAAFLIRVLSVAFQTGLHLAMPLIIIALVMYAAFGIMSRMVPQLQIFFLSLPITIMVALLVLSFLVAPMLLLALQQFEETVLFFLIPS